MIEGALKADGRIAAKNAVKIRAALRELADYKKLYLQYKETMPESTGNLARDRTRARAWAIMNVTELRTEALASSLWRMWAEAYVLGTVAAGEWLRITRELNKADNDVSVDWDNWKPGDRAAALMLQRPKAFQEILDSTNITIRGMSRTSITDIGNSLAEAIDLGLDASSAALLIGRNVASPARALTIAITEQNRVISAATMERYKEAGLEKQEWAVSDPCDICAKNDGAVVPIGTSFPSGDTQPPAHPHCRCVLLPVIPGMEEEPEVPGATMVTPPSPVDFGPDAGTFRTPKEEIEQVVSALQEGRSLNEALDAYQALDSRPYTPGNWEILPQVLNRQAAIDNVGRSLVFPMAREQIERTFFGSNTIKKVDQAFIAKAVIYKNGPMEVQFSSTGLKLTDAERKMVIKEVEKLQATNPKQRAVVHIDKNASGKYGWAYGGKQDLWVTPKTIAEPKRAEGTFKMPATAETTQFQYTLAHEWGHLIDDITQGVQSSVRANTIARLKAEYPNAFKSGYSGENSKEFFAEMFTEYYRTNGQTSNLLVQAMAREFGWKVPEVAGPKIGYVAAKKPAGYFTPQKATELQEGVPWKPDGENLYLKKVLDEQGFNGKPKVVSAAEYKKAVDSGALPLHRGVAGDTPEQVNQFVAQLLTGDTPYIGRGMFGDGTYFADTTQVALKFAKEDRVGNPINFGKTIEAALDPNAKIGYLDDITQEFMSTTKMSQAQKDLYFSYPQDFYEDASMWAASNGYDVIRIKNPIVNWETMEAIPDTYTIVLNRTALIIKEMP
jgi:SPP1 gp7 family putative phage head morphogenesis protein